MDTPGVTSSPGHIGSRSRSQERLRRRSRLLLLAIAIVAFMPLASFGTVGAAQNPNKPIVLPVDVTFPAPTLTRECGFDVTAHVFGTFTVKVKPNGVEHLRIRYDHVFSGPGGSVTAKHTENVKYTATFSPDGTLVEDITATGTLLYHIVLPGHGSLANNSGREVIQITWQYDEDLGEYVEVDFQLLSDSGPNDELSDADWAVLCAELA
jgi:hypothetical protein